MSVLWQDLRYAVRTLRKAPGFTAVAVLVLALGIGANSAIFALADAALVRPLPFHDPARLTMLWERAPSYAHNRVSPLNFLDWSEQTHAFSAIAAVAGGGRVLTGEGRSAERIAGQSVTTAFFDVLGVMPIAGRTFVSADATLAPTVVVIGERFWRTHLGADPAIVGRVITLDATPFTVIGVMPARFQVLFPSDLWTPFLLRRTPEQRRQHYLQVIGRLKPGVSIEQARSDMAAVAGGIAQASPGTNRNWGVTIEPLRGAIIGSELRTTSAVLAGVVAFVLLMACANVASLLLARGLARTREIAVRAALGGSRGRILRQLLTESVLLALLGGAAGLAVAWAAVRSAPALIPAGTLPVSMVLAFDARVAVFAAGVTLVTGILFGLAPAWQAARVPLAEAMSAGGRGSTRGAGALRAALVVGEVATAVLLVSGAGLLIRTLAALNAEDPGFHADHVLTAEVSLPISRYPTPDSTLVFYQAIERELAAVPGIRSVGLGDSLPLDGWNIGQGFEIVGDPPVDKSSTPSAHYLIVGTGYFHTLGIDLVRGRPFDEHDNASGKQICVVNEEFVRRYLKGREPIGALVSVSAMSTPPKSVVREVVGVSRQVKESAGEADRPLEIYVPMAQNPWYSASIAVQTAGDPSSFLPAVKAAVARVDKDEPVTSVRTMEEVAAESTSRPRFRAELIGVFAALALVLAAVGVFGVLAFSVRQRSREFGIRMALGARAGDVVGLVLGDAAKMTGAGVAIGLAAAAGLTRFLSTLLFGVQPLDATTFLATAGVLAASAFLACAIPAIRAAGVDPAVTLRQD
jgi:predicted permease